MFFVVLSENWGTLWRSKNTNQKKKKKNIIWVFHVKNLYLQKRHENIIIIINNSQNTTTRMFHRSYTSPLLYSIQFMIDFGEIREIGFDRDSRYFR